MDIWKHGKYIDTWSVVHLLSGFILSGIFFALSYGFLSALLLSTFLLMLWEVFEWAMKIIEPTVNVVVDIVIGLAGFLVGAYVFYILNQPMEYLYGTSIVTILLSLWGFLDFLKRGYR